MPSGLRRLVLRFVMTMGGEVTQSGFHFGLNIALVRMLTPERYGVFAIIVLIGGVGLTYVRALVGMPLSLHVAQRRGTRASRAYETSFGSAALVVAALAAAAVATLLHFWLHADAGAGACFVGLWALRSYLRTALLAKQRQAEAGLSDVAMALSGVVLALLFLRPGKDGPLDEALTVLCCANVVGIAVALLLQRQPLRVTFRPSMRRRFRGLSGQLVWSAVGTTTANAQAQGLALLIAAFAGPEAYAPIGAMFVFFAPVRLLSSALTNLVQPELASRHAVGRLPGFGRLMLAWIGFAGVLGCAYGAIVIAAVPMIGSKVFDDQPWLAIGLMATGINTAFLISVLPRIMLEILRRFQLIALINAVSAAASVSAVIVLLFATSPDWTLLGTLGGEIVILVWTWAAVMPAPLRAPVGFGFHRPPPSPAE